MIVRPRPFRPLNIEWCIALPIALAAFTSSLTAARQDNPVQVAMERLNECLLLENGADMYAMMELGQPQTEEQMVADERVVEAYTELRQAMIAEGMVEPWESPRGEWCP